MLYVRRMLQPFGRLPDGPHRRRLLRIAVLVAAMMFLTHASTEAVPINCVTSENDGFCEAVGSYVFDGEEPVEQSNIWKFFTDGSFETLIYTIEISGVPLATFDLQVFDRVVTQEDLTEGEFPPLVLFPNAVCIPTFGEGLCGLFDVFAEGESPFWADPGYLLQIVWFSNDDPLSAPPDDGNNTILKAPNFFTFTEELRDIVYLEEPVPDDGAISGRGDGFSTHGAFRLLQPVPEPASLILVGTGLGGLLYRSRRKNRRG